MSDSDADSDFSLEYYEYKHSLDFYRLRWRIRDGPIWENIHVLDDPCDSNSAQTPFQDEKGNLHEVASKPLSPDEDLTKLVVHYLWAAENEEDDETFPKLPFKLPEGQECFTIGDYVLRVHPWLVKHRSHLLQCTSWPSSAEIWVDTRQPKLHGIALLNSAVDDIDKAWAWAACEAQDRTYDQKVDDRQQARMLDGEEPQASFAFHKLRWEVREGGSIQQCIHVATDPTNPDSDSEHVPFQTESGEFHEIANLSATVNPASKLILYFPQLEANRSHLNRWAAHDSSEGGEFDLSPKPDNIASEWSPELTLVPGEGRDFISIKDYVLRAYDWILSMRTRVLEAGHTWILRDGPEEAWLDPTSVYAIGLFNTKQHILEEQWRIVGWSAEELQ